jgi:hypothetical protein
VSRAPAALAMATLLSAARTTGAQPCPPRAQLDGDPAAVARVRDELGRLGVAIGAASVAAVGRACRTVRARVQLGERGGFAIAVVDGSGRSEGRVVSDAALAAAWIDSWLHDELDPMGDAEPARPALPVAVERPAGAAGASARARLARSAVAVGYEQSFDGDASWRGGSAAGCTALGPVCLGGRARYARQTIATTADDRRELAALAVASTAVSLGRMAIVPELGVGVGQLTTQRSAVCKLTSNECDPSTDATCEVCLDAAGNMVAPGPRRMLTSYRPRTAAALRIALPLFDHVWLDAIASFTWVPSAHTAAFAVDAASGAGLPGEPATTLQLGIGLRVGVP